MASVCLVAFVSAHNATVQDMNNECVELAAMSYEVSGDMQKTADVESDYNSMEDVSKCGQYSSYSCSSSCSSRCSNTCTGCCSHKCGQRF